MSREPDRTGGKKPGRNRVRVQEVGGLPHLRRRSAARACLIGAGLAVASCSPQTKPGPDRPARSGTGSAPAVGSPDPNVLVLGGAPVRFAPIPAGEFLMGVDQEELDAAWQRLDWPRPWLRFARDEQPRHRVRLDAFAMSVTEVTVGQFDAYCRALRKPLPEQEEWNNQEDHPIHNVSWEEAVEYCAWASGELRRQGRTETLRLPWEAEWEYAARGGRTGLNGRKRTLFVWGDAPPQGAVGVANLADESTRTVHAGLRIFAGYRDGAVRTAPVGKFLPNGYGLHDMAGNVAEWCGDRYDPEFYERQPKLTINPEGPLEERFATRVVRGGSWINVGNHLRVSYRAGESPEYRVHDLGFRVVRVGR